MVPGLRGELTVWTAKGPSLRGTSAVLEGDVLTLHREEGESEELSRRDIRSLRWEGDDALVSGLGALESWMPPDLELPAEQMPRVQNGAFLLPGSTRLVLNRPLPPLPPRFVVELRLEFPRRPARYELRLFSADVMRDGVFRFTHLDGRILYQEYYRHNAMAQNWNRVMQAPVSRMHDLRFFFNLPEHRVTLLLNGTLEHSWPIPNLETDPLDVEAGIRLSTSNFEPILVRDFRVLPWNGEGPPPYAPVEQDTLLLRNFEAIRGTLRAITDGRAVFELQDGPELPIPLERIREVMLPTAP